MNSLHLIVVQYGWQNNDRCDAQTPSGQPNSTTVKESEFSMGNHTTPKYDLVYAIQAASLKLIKIGHSNSVNKRLADLQGGSPDVLRVIGCWPGSFYDEQGIHSELHQWRHHREWFLPVEPVLELIKNRNRTTPGPEYGTLRLQVGDSELIIDQVVDRLRYNGNAKIEPTSAMTEVISIANDLVHYVPIEQQSALSRIVGLADCVRGHLRALAESRPQRRKEILPDHMRCSFCWKHNVETGTLINGGRAYICAECVTRCTEILAEEEKEAAIE